MDSKKGQGFSDLSIREQAEIFYKWVDACFRFAQDELMPLLRTKGKIPLAREYAPLSPPST